MLDQRNKPIKDQYRAQDISRALTEMLSICALDKVPVQPVAKRFEQLDIPTKVTFIKTASKKRTMLEIRALDRPGLLASFGQVFKTVS